jgi:pimeloyl-ACP methyl ester carboxylesterase
MRFRFLAALLAVALMGSRAGAQPENDPHLQAVKAVGMRQLEVTTTQGAGVARYYGTASLDEGSRSATRALITIHGLLRNADVYEKTGEAAIDAAGAGSDTILITPQFLAAIDVSGDALPERTLRWDVQSWLDGSPALGPAPISSFSVLDAILDRLADRAKFPALREIVMVAHSAGAQVAQRYAVVGHAPAAWKHPGLALRFVIANPSSYLYFSADRPAAGGGFKPYDAATCPGFNHWKYGVDAPPPYVTGPVKALEDAYVQRRVTYLLGQLDTDPNHPVLDKSCPAEAEGPYRLARGRSYVAYLHGRHPAGTNQDTAEVPKVDHDANGMFTSACGIAVIFDRPRTSCANQSAV